LESNHQLVFNLNTRFSTLWDTTTPNGPLTVDSLPDVGYMQFCTSFYTRQTFGINSIADMAGHQLADGSAIKMSEYTDFKAVLHERILWPGLPGKPSEPLEISAYALKESHDFQYSTLTMLCANCTLGDIESRHELNNISAFSYSYNVEQCRLMLDSLASSELRPHARSTPTGDDNSLTTQILKVDDEVLFNFNKDPLLKTNGVNGMSFFNMPSTFDYSTAQRTKSYNFVFDGSVVPARQGYNDDDFYTRQHYTTGIFGQKAAMLTEIFNNTYWGPRVTHMKQMGTIAALMSQNFAVNGFFKRR
jgi:hypothetical protein